MLSTKNLILVCAGADSAAAARHGLPLLQICLGVGQGGAISRLSIPARQQGHYLGVGDLGLDGRVPGFCAEALLYEVRKRNMRGLFADIERDTFASRTLLAGLDQLFYEAGLPLFVPLCQARQVQYAMVVTDTAISGGSLEEYLQDLQRQYPGRIAAALRPVSADFTLPAQDSEGKLLTAEERQALLMRSGAQAFFSRELCARYFTYMDEHNTGHFVLYDDAATIEAKVNRLEAAGIGHIFSMYPDIAALLPST